MLFEIENRCNGFSTNKNHFLFLSCRDYITLVVNIDVSKMQMSSNAVREDFEAFLIVEMISSHIRVISSNCLPR